MGDAGGHGAGLQAIAFDVAKTNVMGVLMPFDNGHLQNIILYIDMIDVAGILRDNFPGHQANDGVGTAILKACPGGRYRGRV